MNTNTLHGGRGLTVNFEPAADAAPDAPMRTEGIRARQIPIRDYEEGFNCYTDEIALVAFLAGKPRNWALELLPESYEELLAVGREVNEHGFFFYCRRRMETELKSQIAISAAVVQLPEDVQRRMMEAGAKVMASAIGNDLSSPPRPRRV